MDSVTIRRLRPDDVATFRQIRLAALRTAPDAFGSSLEEEEARTDRERAERLATSVVLGAFAGPQIVGMAGCKRFDGARENHKAFLWGVYVEPGFRRGGVADLLLRTLLDAMRGSVQQVQLTVVAENRSAIACYERLGFERYGFEAQSLRTARGFLDELLMVLFLSPEA